MSTLFPKLRYRTIYFLVSLARFTPTTSDAIPRLCATPLQHPPEEDPSLFLLFSLSLSGSRWYTGAPRKIRRHARGISSRKSPSPLPSRTKRDIRMFSSFDVRIDFRETASRKESKRLMRQFERKMSPRRFVGYKSAWRRNFHVSTWLFYEWYFALDANCFHNNISFISRIYVNWLCGEELTGNRLTVFISGGIWYQSVNKEATDLDKLRLKFIVSGWISNFTNNFIVFRVGVLAPFSMKMF